MPEEGTYGVICEEPDAKVLSWEEVLFIGHNVMMNKPSVLSTGEWLFFDRGVGEQLEIVICSARGSFHKKTLLIIKITVRFCGKDKKIFSADIHFLAVYCQG